MISNKEALLGQLNQSERLAKSGAVQRWLHQPFKYPIGLSVSKLLFPAFHFSVKARAKTFFGLDMSLQLPAGLDIFLTHAKSHDSELRLAKWMIRHLKPGQTFVDAGAHYGYFSLLADRIGCRVYSFEPTPSTFAMLRENTAKRPVVITKAGLSDTNGEVLFYTFKGSFSEFNSLSAEQYLQQDWLDKADCVEEYIQVMKLDDYCQDNHIIPDCIKIDVEGAEDKVISGARTLLTTYLPVIIMEYHPGKGMGPHAVAAAKLGEWGYAAHLITPDGMHQACSDIEGHFGETGIDSDNLLFLRP